MGLNCLKRIFATFKTRMKLLQETIDKKFSLPKQQLKTAVPEKTIGYFTETIGCLYQ